MSVCTIEGCGRGMAYRASGLCEAHDARVRRHGDPYAEIPIGRRGQNLRGESLICDCPTPTPDGIGECQRCRRLVLIGVPPAP